MKGSVRERKPGFWELRVYVGLDRQTRRSRYVSRYVRGGKRDAESALAQLVTEVGRGHHRPAQGTVAVFFESWLDGRSDELSPWTLRRYRSILANQIVPTIGDRQVTKLVTRDIDDLYRKLRRHGLAPATIRQVHAVLRRGLDDAVRWGDRPDNPADRARRPKAADRELELPDLETVVKLLRGAAETDPDFGVFLRLAAATGARRGELCALRWPDLVNGELRIRRSLTQDRHEKDTKTHAGRRLILDDVTSGMLEDHRARMKARAERADAVLEPRAFMFSNRLNCDEPWSPDAVSHRFARLRDATGVTLRLHDLRHWSNSALLAAGLPINVVSRRHGHRSAKMTLDTYGHAVAAGDQAAADVIAKLLA